MRPATTGVGLSGSQIHGQYALIDIKQTNANKRCDLEDRADLGAGRTFFDVVQCRAANVCTVRKVLRRHAAFCACDADQFAEDRQSLLRNP